MAYHGPNYTRPSYQMPWMMRPLNGPLDGELDKELAIGLFRTSLSIGYPERVAEFDTLFSQDSKENGREAARDRFYECIKTNFVVGVAIPEPTPESTRAFLPLKKVEAVMSCLRGSSKLGVILPILAVSALLFWLLVPRKGKK